MNIGRAAALTQNLLVNYYAKGDVTMPYSQGEECSGRHLYEMLGKIQDGEVTGEKAHRWLGWAQGVMTCRGMGSLKQFKLINEDA